ncbi:MAG: hypothetical protein JO179_07450 [Solirubrobacterales bacterium]|nr:hypothetical protein [Solirubrobacterales bacterium]
MNAQLKYMIAQQRSAELQHTRELWVALHSTTVPRVTPPETRTPSPSRIRRTFGRIKETWDELNYANRRMLEIRTGIPVTREGPRIRARFDDLEPLFAGGESDERVRPATA